MHFVQTYVLASVLLLIVFENCFYDSSAEKQDAATDKIESMVKDAIEKVNHKLNNTVPLAKGQATQQTPIPSCVKMLNLFNAEDPKVARVSNPDNKKLMVMSELVSAFSGTMKEKVSFVKTEKVENAIKKMMPCTAEPTIKCNESMEYRTANGSCNNLQHPRWGMAFTPFSRWLEPDYYDEFNLPRNTSTKKGKKLPSPRQISNLVMKADGIYPLDDKNTMMLMAWGQFVDHDITSTPTTSRDMYGNEIMCCGQSIEHQECFPIEIPTNDPFFNNSCMEFVRSTPVLDDPCSMGKRQQINQITSYQDASNVYGSDDQRMNELREPGNSGKLKTKPKTKKSLPPADKDDVCILPTSNDGQFCLKAGDTRVNEVVHLGGMHIGFVRLHNLIATKLKKLNKKWTGEKIFQESRKIVAALQQIITYNEYLPIILNSSYLTDYCLTSCCVGYFSEINPSINNAFAAAVFRMGHTQIPRNESLMNEKSKIVESFRLDQTFNNPHLVTANKGENVDELMRFVVTTEAGKSDRFAAEEIRDKLFNAPGGSFDLFALNMQRGRDHGLPSYNKWRKFCDLPTAKFFHTNKSGLIHHSSDSVKSLKRVYKRTGDIDLFAGGISETPVPGGVLGPTFSCLLAKQFKSLKLGDRFWWETRDRSIGFTDEQREVLRKVRLSWIICKVFNMDQIQKNVFKTVGPGNRRQSCSTLKKLKLRPWKET